MDRSHILLHLILVATTAAAASCGGDEVTIPDRLRGEPACVWIIGTWGHFADGGVRLIMDEDPPLAGAACVCMTKEEFESNSRVDEVKDMALELCEQLSKQNPFEWNECQQDRDAAASEWRLRWSDGDWEHPNGEALGCVGE